MIFLFRSFPGRIFSITCGVLLLTGCQSLNTGPSLLSNPSLRSINTDFPGNAYIRGKFAGPYASINGGGESIWNYLSWKLNPFRPRGSRETHSETPVLPYVPSQNEGTPHISWLGHSTVVVRLKDTTILIDPILNSPKLFHGKRLGTLPVTATELSVDILLASHAHRDHLDEHTIKSLKRNSMLAFVPLKMGRLIERWRDNVDIVEAGWYQTLTTKHGLELTLLPALHWSRRSLFDMNSVLWGSYLISDGDTTIYIGGDSGYSEHFKEIGALFNNIDYAVLPIGSYEPAQIQKNSHMTPEEAIRAFQDLNARQMVPVHFGTYNISAESVSEPLARLNAEIKRLALPADAFRILDIGEILELN